MIIAAGTTATSSPATFWIAVFGAITGVLGLFLNFLSYRRTASHLKVKLLEGSNSFYVASHEDTETPILEGFATKSFAVIGVELINKSDKPISVRSIQGKIKHSKYRLRHTPKMSINNSLLCFSTGKTSRVRYGLRKSFKLPIRLEPYDIIAGTIRFPFFDDALNESFDPVPITVVFYTSRRTYRLKVRLTELIQLHHRVYPQYKDKVDRFADQ